MIAPPPLTTHDGRPAGELWALDPSLRHLNHSSFGGVPRAAIAQQQRLQAMMHAAPVRWFSGLPARVADARAAVAGYLDVDADRFAFVANASAGCTAVFNSVQLPAGAEIVVTDHGYGAVVMGAHRIARRIGGRVVVARVELAADESFAAQAVIDAFNDRTAMVIVDQITSATGKLLPVARICAAARARGIVSVVDGAHAPLLLPNAISAADADYWFGNLHKFGCAPTGSAVLAPGPDLADTLDPLIDSWGAPLVFPASFDRQGTLDLTAWLATRAAFDEIERHLGWERVRRYVSTLADYAQHTVTAAMSEAIGLDRRAEVGMPAASMRLVALPGGLVSSEETANALRNRMLAELGIEAAFSCFDGRGYLRLSAHAYNNAGDYQDFVIRAVPWLCRLARIA